MKLRGGRYEVLGTIAAGGMATVHLGRALGAGGFERLVAIKTMHPHLAKESEFVAMFLDEARLAARIRHANVVATLDIQQDDDGLFLVMEYVEGASLSRILKALSKRETLLPLDVALRIFTDALAGLHAAHELTGAGGEPLNLIHRDMSPHNVLVGTDGAARLTDFGVARAESRLATTRTGSVKGKVNYMAPEQVKSEAIDRRADLYAAGAVLWEMLTGERLIQSDSHMGMMHQIVEAPHKAPAEVNPKVPAALSEACMRALQKAREDRYPTAAAFAEALEKAATASGVRVAAPRAVAALLRDLDPQIENAAARIAEAGQKASSGGAAATSATSAANAASTASAANVATAVEPPPRSASTRATFSSSAELGAPRRSRTGLLIAVATVLGMAAGAWFAFGRGRSDSASGAPSTAPQASPSASELAPSGSAPPAARSAEPAPSSSAVTSAAPTATATAAARTSASGVPVGNAATARPSATGTGKTFRPREL